MRQKFERPDTAQAAVLNELRRRITRGEIPPGRPVRQETLAADLGVSRFPVREALVALQAERLVHYTQHKGYIVAVLDEKDLTQTYHLREILEAVAIEQALPLVTADTIDKMSATIDEARNAGPAPMVERIERNRTFHFHLFAASQNLRLVALLNQLWDTCDRYRALYYSLTPAMEKVHRDNEEVVKAVAAKDATTLLEILATRRRRGLEESLKVVHAQKVTAAQK